MPFVSLLGHKSTGEGCYSPKPSIEAVDWFTIDDMPVLVEGGKWETHCCGPACHDSVSSKGCDWFTIDDKPIMRIGDEISCGDTVAEGNSWFDVR